MRAVFTIPGKLPSLNDIIGKAYLNRFAANRLKKSTQKFIGQQIILAEIPVFKEPVHITFFWVEPNAKRDIDNISSGGRKYILDALVECGKLKDDSRKYIKGFTDRFLEPNKDDPYVEVVIQTHP